jgi:hypothetical protein
MTGDDDKSTTQPFLARWSQKKQEARAAPAAVAPVDDAEKPLPVLPPIEELTPESDFSGYMHPKVDPALRRAALQKLFSDPHFNVMDGLDTYIDDYSQPNPLPPAMLAGLRQAQNILAWAKETKEETAARFAPPPEESARVAGEAVDSIEAIDSIAANTASQQAPPSATDRTLAPADLTSMPTATDTDAKERKS